MTEWLNIKDILAWFEDNFIYFRKVMIMKQYIH